MIEQSVVLACARERAFALFTERASDWWPEPLRHTGDARSQITLLASGRFWERASDGREVELGCVTAWEPPVRLALDFYPGTGAEHPTEVVVRFSAEGEGTRVVVQHRPKAASADLWAAGAHRFERSWALVLAALEHAAA
ncbi:MAG TPA: SRPBCC domain-containing protein [Gaiellales bacterium]